MSHKRSRLKKLEEKEMKKLKVKSNLNKHHLICSSRGGSSLSDNIAVIDKDKHRNFHHLFDNKLPFEILDELVNYYWHSKDGQTGERFIVEWLRNYYMKN